MELQSTSPGIFFDSATNAGAVRFAARVCRRNRLPGLLQRVDSGGRRSNTVEVTLPPLR
jgi:hypothetical protein